MSSDYIMRQIEDITRCVATILFARKSYRHETEQLEAQRVETNFLFYRLKRLLLDGKINEAENLLFREVEADPSAQNLRVALDFYEELQGKSEEELKACNFSRAEIYEGLVEIKNLCGEA